MEVQQLRSEKKTFIQTGRRGRDGQLGQRGCTARQQLEDWVDEAVAGGPGGPKVHVDKLGGTTGE